MKHEIIKDLNSSVVLIDGMGEYLPLTQHDKEVEALRAQVELLREFALSVNRKCAGYITGGNRINHEDMGAAAYDVYKATSGQCLAEIKAQAGRDGFVECYFALRRAEHGDGFDLVKSANEYANQLRQQAKGE